MGPLVPVEKDASSCSLYPHACEAVFSWEADRQCFSGSSGELGIDKMTRVETFRLELWERQHLPFQSHSVLWKGEMPPTQPSVWMQSSVARKVMCP